MEGEPVYVRVLYNFDYTTKETKLVSIRQGEKLELLKQTNGDWWQVKRDSELKSFYVPASYVREIPPPFIKPTTTSGQKIINNFKNTKNNDLPTIAEYQNIKSIDESPPPPVSPRKSLEAALRQEVIHGNFKNKNAICDKNKINNDDKLQDDTHQLGNLVQDIKVQQKVSSFDNRGNNNSPLVVTFQPLTRAPAHGESKSYSVVTPVNKKPPIPCPRVKELSKSLETLAEEIQFTPSESGWKNVSGETSDYHTPSPDYLDSDMFWRKSSAQPINEDTPTTSNNLQKSSSFRTRWPSRKKKRERKRAALHSDEASDSESRSLESLVDSGAEACSSSSYEWDKSGEGSDTSPVKHVPPPVPLAFRNFTYRSSDSEEEEEKEKILRPRSVSDTAVQTHQLLKPTETFTDIVRSESHLGELEQPRPLVSLKRNQKQVGCRRRPALLCIPSSNDAAKKKANNREVYLPRAPKYPPSPAPHEKPLRVLHGGWAEFWCSDAGGTGRIYYFHAVTGDRSWKPPRIRRANEFEGSAPEDGVPSRSRSPSPSPRLVLPPGWEEAYDNEAEMACYVNKNTGAKWFSSSDREGRLYFFEENSNESSWTLPENSTTSTPSSAPPPKSKSLTSSNNSISSTEKKDKPMPTSAVKAAAAALARQGALADRRCTLATTECRSDDNRLSGDEEEDTTHVRARLPPGALLLPAYTPLVRGSKTRSMVLVDSAKRSSAVVTEETASKCASIPRNWPQLWDSGMGVLKEGMLNKTKLTEHGKKLRKNWAPSHVVLTDMFLLFCRDAKSFAAIKSGNLSSSMPEMCVGLNCASLDNGEKLSSRKNVFVVSTTDGLQVLCQEENMSAADSWFYNIGLAIKNYGTNTTPRVKLLPSREPSPQTPDQPDSPPEEKKSNSSLNRSKSVKIKKDTGSVEDLTASPTSSNSAEQTKIKNRLRKFFVRRPTKESLVKKGILQDEPAFGSYLSKLCREMPDDDQIPVFVKRCIAAIEGKPENMKTDGLYRASGNLSQVQKIRLQVDQNNLGVLDLEEDVHVLTGALKLFFRELKEPLIPFDAFSKALKASTNPNKKEKLQQFRDIVRNLPGPHHDTLKCLLQHLLRVTQEQASNRMHIPNLAIVFGPTLMWPEEESLNMAFDLMQQNIVIESLLQEFEIIFR